MILSSFFLVSLLPLIYTSDTISDCDSPTSCCPSFGTLLLVIFILVVLNNDNFYPSNRIIVYTKV